MDAHSNIQSVGDAVIETVLFNRIFGQVIDIFKLRYKKQDENLSQKIKSFQKLTPLQLEIPKEFWLCSEVPTRQIDKQFCR